MRNSRPPMVRFQQPVNCLVCPVPYTSDPRALSAPEGHADWMRVDVSHATPDPATHCVFGDCTAEPTSWVDLPVCQEHAVYIWSSLDQAIKDMAADFRRSTRPAGYEPSTFLFKSHQKLGVIYYLQVSGYIKIGHSVDLKMRLRSYPPDTRLLAVKPGLRKDEQAVHEELKPHRLARQEWYSPSPAVLAHIERVKGEHGIPADPRFVSGKRTKQAMRPSRSFKTYNT